MAPATLRDTYKILDPACGSGVFLVGAYRRLVEAWQSRNQWKRPTLYRHMLQLLSGNIFGVDKDAQAVELTIFSLCITLAGHLEATRIWEELRFPKLKGSNLFAQDFFQLIQVYRHFTEPFDLVIGNPPFGSEVAYIAKEVERNRVVAGCEFPGSAGSTTLLPLSQRIARTVSFYRHWVLNFEGWFSLQSVRPGIPHYLLADVSCSTDFGFCVDPESLQNNLFLC